MNVHRLLQTMKRQLAGKPPLVARIDRFERSRWHARLRLKLRRWLLRAALADYPALKWRWLRGEIKDRRRELSRLCTTMSKPLQRRIDYVAIAEKLFLVQPLPDQSSNG